jgi:hypothetical protein
LRKRHLLFLFAPFVLALGLAACGEGKSDEDKIVEAIDFALVSTDPEACKEQRTQAFNEQTFRVKGAEAVEYCEQNARAEESPNDPVEVTNIEIDGSKATADIDTQDTQSFSTSLVEEDGDWKLDEFVRFVDFNRGEWIKEEREGFENGGEDALEPQVVDCIIGAYREMSRAEIEAMWFGGSARLEIEIYERCGA